MANEIDMYNDLEELEKFLAFCVKKHWVDTAKRTAKHIVELTKKIKKEYPELAWKG